MNTQVVKVGNSWKVLPETQLEHTILTCIQTFWESKSAYFPGPQPISIERKHFSILKKGDYVVCEKTDGVRHVLISCMFGDKKICALVNRAFDIFIISLNLPKAAYQGSLFDGELIDNFFIVHDAVTISGTNVKNLGLFERIQAAENVLFGIVRMKNDTVTLKIKTFFDLKDFKKFIGEYLPTITYRIDGLIFTPVHEPVRTGTHETMFKWKPRDANTIDFQFKKWDQQNKWGMYVQEHNKFIFESELSIEKAPEWITEDCIAECQYMCDEYPRWWKPLTLRTDKKHPNNRKTFYRTLENIRENIQIGEFAF